MNRIIRASERLNAAIDLPGVLESAYGAFENVLAVLRHHQEDDEAVFAAFILSANAAANGRDWIAWAPALPSGSPRRDSGDDLLGSACVTDVVLAIAEVSAELARRLSTYAVTAADIEDRECCGHAAAEAAAIHALMSGGNPP